MVPAGIQVAVRQAEEAAVEGFAAMLEVRVAVQGPN